jgi:isoleucyl-tRNA synthetase
MARTIKDVICRYKTMQGFRVERKAGWDTHGLPVELGVEKELGITKEDIGKTISVEEYNQACKEAVMRYTDIWNSLTQKMGYWVDMQSPYVTYQTKYIESVWHILSLLYNKELLYHGFTIQPYSPKAGTGLSSHELNQPGTYRDVKDTSLTAQFKLIRTPEVERLFGTLTQREIYILAWTTTPWTLPSNTALTVGASINYCLLETTNRYSGNPVSIVMAKDRIASYFDTNPDEMQKFTQTELPYTLKSGEASILKFFKGEAIVGLRYEQLLKYALPMEHPENAFRIISGDFVTTEDGTGIVHTAPTFGADDMRVAKAAGVPPMLVSDKEGNPVPLVDLQGRFIEAMGEFAGMYVKNEYYDDGTAPEESVDVQIAMKLKREGLAFRIEKYIHSYPHCWRTDKPVLYYPLNSWFVKTTAVKERLIALNKTINWKPTATGTGRFGNWLENLQDWNLSRSRFWGIPLPIWTSEDKSAQKVIGSLSELYTEIENSVAAGFMSENPFKAFVPEDFSDSNYELVDLHKHIVDKIILVSQEGKKLYREPDLIDVWFDSGSMPYAQWHFPFENQGQFKRNFPADFIAEGVDQTRGWFFTLHAISTMAFDSIAFKNVISNGLVLDKNGQKMSKRLGNAVNPFEMLDKYGADAVRWYMVTNAQPWDNLKFDEEGILEVQRKFFRALFNSYSFFSLYANVDEFVPSALPADITALPELDRWILSKLQHVKMLAIRNFDAYEITQAGRLIQDFVVNDLSNWWVRLNRKRFWRGSMTPDKELAYNILFHCLKDVSMLMAPIAPFYAERLYKDLMRDALDKSDSVHISILEPENSAWQDEALEQRMDLAQRACSLILAIRKKENLKVRQPLLRAIIPAMDDAFVSKIKTVEEVICTETNLKQLDFVSANDKHIRRKAKANFKVLGPKVGAHMKAVAAGIQGLDQIQMAAIEKGETIALTLGENRIEIGAEDVELNFEDIPGWTVATDGVITLALDLEVTPQLKREGIARELVNRIQNMRKDSGLEVTDRIKIRLFGAPEFNAAIEDNLEYIRAETLADSLEVIEDNKIIHGVLLELEETGKLTVEIQKT